MKKKANDLATRLRERALKFPGAWEDHPWGDTCVKVGKKILCDWLEESYRVVAPKKLAAQLDGRA